MRTTTMSRVYGYVRYSTDRQDDEGQRDVITRKALADGRTIDTWISDPAVSGKIALYDRPGGKELGRMLHKGDTVYVAKLDRAFRRAADCAVVMERWGRLGINVVICDLLGMTIDLSSPIGRFIVLILAAVAELEREFISSRTKESLRVKKKRRQAVNRFPGYGKEFRRTWEPDEKRYVKKAVDHPEERGIMREIVKWRMEGCSWQVITEHLANLGKKTREGKDWSVMRVRRAWAAELRMQLEENGGSQ